MKQTKGRILSEGVKLLSRSGLAGITLGALADETGLSKSGLFAHFRSKEEMQIGLLEASAQLAQTSFVEHALKIEPGLARLRAVVQGWLGWTERAGLGGGCPVAAAMFELDDAPELDPVRTRLLAFEAQWRDLLTRLVTEAVEAGELRREVDVDQFVWELCGVYLQHHASHRFLRDPLALERATTAFEALLDRSRYARRPQARKARATSRGKKS